MIKHDDIQKFYEYSGSFEKFMLDFYGVETKYDLTELDARITEPEEIVLAHIVWKMLFGGLDKNYMVVVPNQTLAVYWHGHIIDAINQLPDYMKTKLTTKWGCIETGTLVKLYIRVCNENIARGMTLNGVYVIESQMVKPRVYQDFMCSVVPSMFSTNGQIVHYSRGH